MRIDRSRAIAWLPAFAVALAAVVVSLSGIGNGYAYDDVHIIQNNARVHDVMGAWRYFGQPYWPPPQTGEVYRPLTLLLFALQWALGGGSPLVFHVVSIALYAVVCVAVYRLALLVLGDARRAALAAALLFAVHPVHVESVANVVGQAELVVALLLTVAVSLFVRWRREAPGEALRRGRVAALVALFLLACFTKEHGIVLPALLVLAEWLLVPQAAAEGATGRRLRALAPLLLAMLVVAVGFLAVRTVVVGGLGGATSLAFRGRPLEERLLNALAAVPHWIRLLLWPAALSADYSAQHVPLRTSLGVESLGALFILLGVPVLALAAARRLPAVAFAIAFVVVAILPVSNLVVPTGIVVAERTLFLASIGAMLLVGALAAYAAPRAGRAGRTALAGALAALLLLGGWRSWERQPVWRDSATIFAQTLVDAPLSYKAHWLAGVLHAAEGDRAAAIRELRAAALLLPEHGYVQRHLGQLYREDGRCAEALPPLRRAVKIMSWDDYGPTILADCLLRQARFREASRWAHHGLENDPRDSTLALLARVADSILVARDSVPAGGGEVPLVTTDTAMRPLAARRSSDR